MVLLKYYTTTFGDGSHGWTSNQSIESGKGSFSTFVLWAGFIDRKHSNPAPDTSFASRKEAFSPLYPVQVGGESARSEYNLDGKSGHHAHTHSLTLRVYLA